MLRVLSVKPLTLLIILFSLFAGYCLASVNVDFEKYESELIRIVFGSVDYGNERAELQESEILNDGTQEALFFSYFAEIFIEFDLKNANLDTDTRKYFKEKYPEYSLIVEAQEIKIKAQYREDLIKLLKQKLDAAQHKNWEVAERFVTGILVDELRLHNDIQGATRLLVSFLNKTESSKIDPIRAEYYPFELMLLDLIQLHTRAEDFQSAIRYSQRLSSALNVDSWYLHIAKSLEIHSLINLGNTEEAHTQIRDIEGDALRDNEYDSVIFNNISEARILMLDNNYASAKSILQKNYAYFEKPLAFLDLPRENMLLEFELAILTNEIGRANELLTEIKNFKSKITRKDTNHNNPYLYQEAQLAFAQQKYKEAAILFQTLADQKKQEVFPALHSQERHSFNKRLNDEEVSAVKYEYQLLDTQRKMWFAISIASFLFVVFVIQIALRLRSQKLRLQVESNTDFLTQISNRKHSLVLIKNRLNNFNRDEDRACMALLDIDKFKLINDTYGHDAGDAVLKTFSSYIRSNIREGDLVGRYGGEEFILMLNNTSLDAAIDAIENIRTGLIHTTLSSPLEDYKIKFSCGLIELKEGVPLEYQINKCDELLYRAKENGRNRTEAFVSSA